MVADRIIAAGLALFVPIMSLATCRQPGSKRAYSWMCAKGFKRRNGELVRWKGTYRSDVTSWNNARTTDEGGADVGDNRTVQVGHHHDVELLGLSDQLHRTAWGMVNPKTDVLLPKNVRVIDNHVIESDSGGFILLGDATESVKE